MHAERAGRRTAARQISIPRYRYVEEGLSLLGDRTLCRSPAADSHGWEPPDPPPAAQLLQSRRVHQRSSRLLCISIRPFIDKEFSRLSSWSSRRDEDLASRPEALRLPWHWSASQPPSSRRIGVCPLRAVAFANPSLPSMGQPARARVRSLAQWRRRSASGTSTQGPCIERSPSELSTRGSPSMPGDR